MVISQVTRVGSPEHCERIFSVFCLR